MISKNKDFYTNNQNFSKSGASNLPNVRRYFVLTKSHLYSFKDDNKTKVTEAIVLRDCTTIKSADDEIHK